MGALESRPLPELARTAVRLAQREYARAVTDIGAQTLDVLGLAAADGWAVDFDAGLARREARP